MKELTASSLYQLKTVTNPVISPDGNQAIVVVTELKEEENAYESHLYVVNLKTSEKPTQLTFGKGSYVSPKWLPSGDGYTYLASVDGKKKQVFVKRGLAQEKQVTDEKQGVQTYALAADGRSIVYSALYKETTKEENKPQPLVVDRMKYKSDARGLYDESTVRIGHIDLTTNKQQWLTSEKEDSQLLDYSADGKHLLFTSDRLDNKDFSFTSHVYMLNMDTNEEQQVTKEPHVITGGAFSPDGQAVALLSHQREYENATLPNLVIYHLETGTVSNVTEDFDQYLGDGAIGDFLQQNGSNGIRFSNDGDAVYSLVSNRGAVNVWRFALSGEKEKQTSTNAHINGFDFFENELYVTHSRVEEPSEFYHVNQQEEELERLTTFNQKVEQTTSFSVPEPFHLNREDGSFVEGWLMKPINYEDGQSYPLIVEVHGGPHAMYANTYFHEFQMLTAKGYGVLYTNPRGSHGYGQTFVDAVRGDYGGGDYKDLMEILDHAVETHTWIDQARIGLTGGSYGGFMTNWAVGHTNRFKAAVTQRSISNWISFYGVSDIGYYFSDWQIKAELDDIETLWNHSPLKYVAHVETPLLILHGENDLRCPIEQGEQLFIALKRLGKDTRLIRFPEANHELSRSGKPNLRIERLEAILGWFERYLKI
ncbi:S9 family peptidase [Bacillus sp. Marseille-P3800]|uniref:S9 family peptidase n=1 Tax=Bacillus sp. Marseille-P3800 TaxID=2014782 RepID=UPI000C081503|nr:S9 family peptidase [Bacillus sp. Marseille-P3800]